MSNKSTPNPHPARSGKRKWPDMSSYGIHFGVVEMPNGESRLVMVDDEGSWAPLAKSMGFSQSRWFGLYVKASTKLDIPGFHSNFPSAKVLELSDDEIRARIRPLILARKNQRVSQMHAGRGRLSWHPSRTEIADAAARAAQPAVPVDDTESAATLSPEQALRQTLLLGMNYMGQDVYESGDGQRFVRSGDAIVAKEGFDAVPNPVFLRIRSDEDLVQVAAGMVMEIDANKRLHSDDFIRFMEASLGTGAHEDKEAVGRFHAALDRASRDRVTSIEGAGRDVFDEALRLHEGRPTFWRAPGTMATPLPISVVMQSLASARANSTLDAVVAPVIIDLTGNPKSHSWSLAATSISGGDVPVHDIGLAGVFGKPAKAQSISGIRVTRTDTEMLLETLAKRRADGLTVFAITADVAGTLDNEFRRVLSAIGQKYEVSGLTDIDAAMIGAGSEHCSRLVVIGNKRASPDYTFAVQAQIQVIYDYSSLWNWGEALRASQFGEVQTFGDDGREENRWQAPYIPASQVSEPESMSPRNLLGPVRKALANIVEKTGLGIDEFVCSKLGWTMAQLEDEKRLSSEQTDAVALGIQAIDDGMGLVEADATGLGKGRVTAALAVYGRRKGLPVMFMTEKSDLFSDFYRDVVDIGSMDQLGKPFIINNELIVRDSTTAVEIARSPKREFASMTLACGEIPVGYDLVMATYSQFNRKYDSKNTAANTRISRAIKGLLSGAADPFQAMQACHVELGMVDYSQVGVIDSESAIAYEENQAMLKRIALDEGQALECDARVVLLGLSKDDLVTNLSERIKADMTTLKHQWLYSGAMNGGLVILDESHVAAGENSQTGVNLRHLMENAGALTYSSATFAKDTGNFLLYARLFPDTLRAATIAETLSRGGEPMQEILSAMLAEDGRLVRREHDLSNLEFKLSTDAVRKDRNEMWANGFAQVLSTMSFLSGEVEEIVHKQNAAAEAILKNAKASKGAASIPKVGLHYTNFGSKLYNLSRTFTMAVNADLAADLAIKALKEGRKPVITVESTMETVLKELIDGVTLDDDGLVNEVTDEAASAVADTQAVLASLDPLAGIGGADAIAAADPLAAIGEDGVEIGAGKKVRTKKSEVVELGRRVGFRDILLAYIDSMFVASIQTRKGNKLISSVKTDMMTPEMQVLVDNIRRDIAAMPDIPLSPIDMVRDRIAAAGYTVDEISGRRMFLKENEDGTHSVVRMGERKKQPLKNAFNSGQLDALILSRSGSTGISLHANRTFADQSQRELIELQPAADIAQRLQFWGRVNRKGQVCSPIIHMVSSALPAEMRLITMQNSKLRKMSANISGNADNSAINENAPDILNRIGNEVCYRWMEANPKISAILGYRVGEIPEEQAKQSNTKFVDMLTGRMMMLNVDTQRKVYAEITSEFKAVIEQFELEGRNPLKSAEHDLRARRTDTLVLQVASGADSVFNAAVAACELTYDIQVGAIVRETAEAEMEAGRTLLLETYGKDYARTLADACLEALEVALPDMLPKRFDTIEAAMADAKQNAVKNAKYKFEWLSEFLPRVPPGSVVAFGSEGYMGRGAKLKNDEDSFVERVYVTGWKIPEANRLSLSGYKLEGYSSRTRKRVEMSMSAILSRPTSWVESSSGAGRESKKQYASDMDDFFNRTALPMSGTEKRVILDGNLYRAAEIAEAQKQGSAITYTDEKGVWHHAVLMPKIYTMKNVGDLPVAIDNVETLIAAIASRGASSSKLIVSDDFRQGLTEGHAYRLYGNADGVGVTVGGSADTTGWLLNDDAIKATLKNGDFQGSRAMRDGRVTPGMEDQFLRAFMVAANNSSAKVLMGGEMRAWFNEYLKQRTGESASPQDMVEAALSTTEDDELGALLNAPSP